MSQVGTWIVNSPATSVVSLVLMVRAPGARSPLAGGAGGRGSLCWEKREQVMAGALTLIEDEVGKAVQDWAKGKKRKRGRKGIGSDVRVEPGNGGGGEPRPGARNQCEWGARTEE